jgi:purine-binding chemotaxis protein CheW
MTLSPNAPPTATDPQAPFAAGSQDSYLILSIAGERFGLPAWAVREIRGWTPPTPLPGAAHALAGVVNLRGTILPVIDAALRLGLEPASPAPTRPVIVVLELDGTACGVVADRVSDILALPRQAIEQPPLSGHQTAPGSLLGITLRDGGVLRLLAPRALLPSPADQRQPGGHQ